MRPIVKWAGGKTSLLPVLLEHLPDSWQTYREPFCGGATLYLSLADTGRAPMAVLSDACEPLVLAYQALTDDPDGVCDHLQVLVKHHYRERFLQVRERWNACIASYEPSAHHAAAFVYLARSGFNGLWRVNQRGEYNVPWGAQPVNAVFQPDVLRAAAPAFRAARLVCQDWQDALAATERGDFVYLDPPYDSGGAGFTGYAGSWTRVDTENLFLAAAALADRRGVRLLMSNADTAFCRSLCARVGVTPVEVSARGSIGATGARRGRRVELLIRFGY